MLDDAELLRRYAAQKSEAAFAELVQRHLDLVYSAALRQVGGDAHRARDVAQEVFATLARKSAALGGHPVLAGWLYNTTQHLARRAVRAEQRRRVREAEALRMNETDAGAEHAADWERIRPVLDAVMRELGEGEREAVVLRFFARRQFAEIGRVLGVSEDAARMRVERALERLRGRLARRGVTSTAGGLALVLSSQAVTAAPAGLAASVATAATAASAVSLTPVMLVVNFMSTSKLVLGGTTVAVLLALGTAVQDGLTARAASEAHALAESDVAAMRERIAALRRKTELAEAEAAKRLAEPAPRATAPARAAVDPLASDPAAGNAFIARHPEVQRLLIESRRAQAAGSYAALFKLLNLSAAQIERFSDLAGKGTGGVFNGPNGELVRYEMASPDEWRQAEAELRTLLGEDGYELYRNYSDALGPAWQTTVQLAGDLASTSTSLSAAQAGQLQRVLFEGRVTREWSGRPQYDWPAILERAAQFLSPEQVTALNDHSSHDRFSQAMTQARKKGEIK